MENSNSAKFKHNLNSEELKMVAEIVRTLQWNLTDSLSPSFEILRQTHDSFIESMQTSLIPFAEYYEDIIKSINLGIKDIFKNQYEVISSLSDIRTNIYQNSITHESSLEFTEVSLAAINELSHNCSSENIGEAKETIIECSSKNETLTWDKILFIITFIINLTMLVQSQMPNKQLTNIENHLQQLIEIQTKELDLLRQVSE